MFSEHESKETLSLLRSFSGSLSLPSLLSVSFTSSPLSTVREGSHEEHHSLICLTRLYEVCMCVRDTILSKRVEKRQDIDIFNDMVYFTHALGEEAGRMKQTYRHTLCLHTHTHPWSVPLLVSQVVLRFDLDTVGQPKSPSLSLPLFFPVSLLHFRWLCLLPCSRLDGWPDSLGVFRFWRDPNFLF